MTIPLEVSGAGDFGQHAIGLQIVPGVGASTKVWLASRESVAMPMFTGSYCGT